MNSTLALAEKCNVLAADFNLDRDVLAKRVLLEKYPDSIPDFDRFCGAIDGRLTPKTVFRMSTFTPVSEERFSLEDGLFTSKIVNQLLEPGTMVFPFIASCGPQLETLDLSGYDFLAPFWLDSAKELALEAAMETLKNHLSKQFSAEFITVLSPGAADPQVWDIRDQQPLFQLFEDAEKLVGVRLTETFLMIPNKSVSGIAFAGNEAMSDCRFCTRQDCKQRKEKCDFRFFH